MGDARQLGRLQARAGEDVGGEGEGSRTGDAGADHARPVGQLGAVVHRRKRTGNAEAGPGSHGVGLRTRGDGETEAVAQMLNVCWIQGIAK